MADLQTNDSTVNDFVVDRLLNYNVSAEGGKGLPPRQRGSSRVPAVTGFQIIKTQQQTAGTVFTLAWIEPQDDPSQPIDHYAIYATKYLDNNSSPVGLYTSQHSPAVIFVPADAETPVSFTIQTVLKNGTMSSLNVAPTVGGIASLPSVAEQILGYQIQPLDISASTNLFNIAPTISDTKTILNLSPSKGGELISLSFVVNSAITDPSTCTLSISVDGMTPETLPLTSAGVGGINLYTRTAAERVIGDGTSINDTVHFNFNLTFNISLLVQVVLLGSNTAGAVNFVSLYSYKT